MITFLRRTGVRLVGTVSGCAFALLLALGATTTSAQGDQAFQPAILTHDTPVAGQFEDFTTAVLYAFNASQGDLASISMNAPESALDPYLVLFGDNGMLLTFDDDSGDDFGGAQYSALIHEFELPYDGSYYVLAASYDYIDGVYGPTGPLTAPQPFEIMVSGITPPDTLEGFDPDATMLTAHALEMGAPLDLELTSDQPVAYVRFEGTEGETRNLLVAAESNIRPRPIIHLFGPDGRRVAMSRVLEGDPDDDTRTANLVDLVLPADGPYLLMTMDVFFMDRVGYPDSDYGLGAIQITIE